MKKALVLFLAVGFLNVSEVLANGDDIIGIWKPSNERSMLKIDKEGDKYYAQVVWLLEPNDENGNPRTDINNPDESLRSTPLKGHRILKDLIYDEDEQVWTDGTIYDPNNGSTYSCTIEKKDDNTIEVRGYIGASIFGRTDVWSRMKRK
ncbi:MAG: DUF2147 domain-containing protein [Bacteroidota bacterium]